MNVLTSREAREEIVRQVRQWLEGAAEPEYLACEIYECDGRRRFLVYGTVPTTPHKAGKLFKELSKTFGLNKKRGPKKKITLAKVMKEIESAPATATLSEVAGTLKVSERAVERVIGPLRAIDEAWGAFDGLQAAIKGKGKLRAKKVFFKKLRRR